MRAGNVDFALLLRYDETIDRLTTVTTTTLIKELYEVDGTTVMPIGAMLAAVPLAVFDHDERFNQRLRDFATADGSGVAALVLAQMVTGSTGDSAAGTPGDDPDAPFHMFAEGYGFDARTSGEDDRLGDRRTAYGFDGGAGFDVTETLRLGAGIDIGHTDVDIDDVDENADLDLVQGGLFAAYHPDPYYIRASLSYGHGDVDTSSTPAGTDFTASADYDLWQFGASAEAGVNLGLGGATVTPSVGLAYFHVDVDGFREKGSPFDMRADDADYGRTEFWAGLAASRHFAVADGMGLDLAGYLRVVGLAGDRQIDVPVAFPSGGPSATIKSPTSGAIGADVGASLGLAMTKNASLSLGYDGRFRDRAIVNAGRVGFKLTW